MRHIKKTVEDNYTDISNIDLTIERITMEPEKETIKTNPEEVLK